MTLALALAAALAAPARAATIKLFAYDEKGKPLALQGLLARLGRADDKEPRDPERAPLWAWPLDEKSPPARVKLAQQGPILTASWPGGPARLALVWPVKEDGVNEVSADGGGQGFADGAAVFLDEEIARTQYRLFKESWTRRTTDWRPIYEPGKKAKKLAEKAQEDMVAAERETEAPKRAAAFASALRSTANAWEKGLFEHGLRIAHDERRAKDLRFGLTLDESLIRRLDDLDWIVEAVERSGSNWVRLVFRPNGADFSYASLRSFNEYDGVIAKLRDRKINVMGCVLDTAQWPKAMTPAAYAERVKNLVLHYKGRVAAWEVGPEINGDWLGGAADPLPPDQVFKIFAAGAAKAKELDPQTETVATLYWWEATAPDRDHALSGWLKRFVPQGFAKNIDVVGLELYPEDNPVGMSLERAFDEVADALPGQRLMLSSFGYVEKDDLQGYWWLDPKDVDGARKDLLILYTAASCAMTRSLCGGFWWQTLDHMLPSGCGNYCRQAAAQSLPSGHRKAADIYKVYRRILTQLGRKE